MRCGCVCVRCHRARYGLAMATATQQERATILPRTSFACEREMRGLSSQSEGRLVGRASRRSQSAASGRRKLAWVCRRRFATFFQSLVNEHIASARRAVTSSCWETRRLRIFDDTHSSRRLLPAIRQRGSEPRCVAAGSGSGGTYRRVSHLPGVSTFSQQNLSL